ncbi:uncharacterized protein B0T23DRAFT_327390 [Neurospora hispaniola]|uniref:Uncharacterized protein n=1 Tax=Neurospora hispaniola TaxID=588809 RepID=A0AAJ0HZ85_9PEZI|nr:hypothetical protein B0T23DRAFT_327390 [Neurospora hispaniola]
MNTHDIMMAMLQAFNVSEDDEQRLPGSEAQAPAQASSSSSRREYFMNAMREEVSDDMFFPTPHTTLHGSPMSEPNLDPNPTPTPPSPGPSPTRRPMGRVRSMPPNLDVADSYMYGRFSSVGTTATGGEEAATKPPLPIRLQAPTQASAPNRVTKASSHSHHKSSGSREPAMRELETSLEQTAYARRMAKLARRSKATARVQERRMASENRRNVTRLWILEQQLMAQVRAMDASWRLKYPGYGMNKSSAAAGAGGGVPPPLGLAMEEDGSSGYGQGNVSGDEEMDDGLSHPDRLESRRAGLFYLGQIMDMMDPLPDTASIDGNAGSDDDQMEE